MRDILNVKAQDSIFFLISSSYVSISIGVRILTEFAIRYVKPDLSTSSRTIDVFSHFSSPKDY